jgi:hypothetical protein
MPRLDVRQPQIEPPTTSSFSVPHPSPRHTALRLERKSIKEQGWWGLRFGIDTPYFAYPLGWGEWAPLLPGEVPLHPEDVVILYPAEDLSEVLRHLWPHPGLYPRAQLFPH